jgi:hypothetical protein
VKIPSIELYSGIRSTLKRRVLFRGIIFALIGVILWVVCGALVPERQLSIWGPVIFFAGGLCIALGLVPYRRLTDLENRPHRLGVSDDTLHFSHKGKLLFSIPIEAITKTEYRNGDSLYGIAIWLMPQAEIHAHRSTICSEHYMKEVRRKHECDLFLPDFGAHTYERLKELVEESSPEHC